MVPKTVVSDDELFRHPLRDQINLKHPIVRLAVFSAKIEHVRRKPNC